MPVVNVDTWPMPEEKKPELMKKITQVFVDFGIPAEAVTIILNETKLENWASGGEQHSVKFKHLNK